MGLEPTVSRSTIWRVNRLRYRHHIMRPKGLEPPAHCLEGSCSIHLSYGRTLLSHGVLIWRQCAFGTRCEKYNTIRIGFCQAEFQIFLDFDKSITKFNKFSPDFLCILAQHKQAVKFCFLAASFIRSVLPILSSRPAFPAMRSLSYIMVTLLFVMRSAPVPAGIGGTWSPHSYTRESSGGSC